MKKFLLYFFGICCVISSVVGFIQYGILNGVTCLIIGVVLISLARQPSDPVAVDAPENVQPQSQPQRTKTITFDVAGVTFSNESGRLRSRQTILKKFPFVIHRLILDMLHVLKGIYIMMNPPIMYM